METLVEVKVVEGTSTKIDTKEDVIGGGSEVETEIGVDGGVEVEM